MINKCFAERAIDLEVVLDDDSTIRAVVLRPYPFRGSHIRLDSDRGLVCFEAKKELDISATIEEKGYEVVFRDESNRVPNFLFLCSLVVT